MSSTIPPSVFAFVMYQIFNWKNYVWFAFFVNSIQFNTGYLVSLLCNVLYPTSVTICTCYIWVYFIIIKWRSDVQEHPGPQYNLCRVFSIFHWNLNNVCEQNLLNYPFSVLKLLLTDMTFYASLKLFWIGVLHLMMLIWIFQDIT